MASGVAPRPWSWRSSSPLVFAALGWGERAHVSTSAQGTRSTLAGARRCASRVSSWASWRCSSGQAYASSQPAHPVVTRGGQTVPGSGRGNPPPPTTPVRVASLAARALLACFNVDAFRVMVERNSTRDAHRRCSSRRPSACILPACVASCGVAGTFALGSRAPAASRALGSWGASAGRAGSCLF